MELLPAIDLRAGRVVRLTRGDYAEETVYGDDPVAVAHRFAAEGARWIHVVDLDAARTGEPTNRAAVAAIAAAMRAVGVAVESGGGVRSEDAAVALWDVGVQRVVLGTAAVEDPALVRRLAARRDEGSVAVGLDARSGAVAVRGWLDDSGSVIGDVLAGLADAGIAAVIVTEIDRDGTLGGPDLLGLSAVLDQTSIDVIASGGVSSAADVVALAALRGPRSGRALAGAIVGRALYEGRLSVEDGVAACAASG
ncbi:MAG: HisA/HisF-related TIM barrel protein [Acidimicrobiales bacterium]